MSAALWAADLAERFWDIAGEPGPFPRDLRQPAESALPLAVIDLPNLCVAGMLDWLTQRGIALTQQTPDRPLRAALAAWAGTGLIFLDANDPLDERRFSLAHELAHFLNDYWQPRQRAEHLLGPTIDSVFDGVRPPTQEERLHATLRGLTLSVNVHLLERKPHIVNADVAVAECDADRLACELLAPAATILSRYQSRSQAEHALRETFGLPSSEAAAYAADLYSADEFHPLFRRLRSHLGPGF